MYLEVPTFLMAVVLLAVTEAVDGDVIGAVILGL